MSNNTPYTSYGFDEGWAVVAPYLALVREDTLQRVTSRLGFLSGAGRRLVSCRVGKEAYLTPNEWFEHDVKVDVQAWVPEGVKALPHDG